MVNSTSFSGFISLFCIQLTIFASGPLALNTKLLNYGTAKDQMPSAAIMGHTMAVLGLCFDTLKEGDRSAYNDAFHESMVDYNNRDDARTTPKP